LTLIKQSYINLIHPYNFISLSKIRFATFEMFFVTIGHGGARPTFAVAASD